MEPWEQLPGESARAYEAARLYFELGPARSLATVGQKVGKSKALIERWSARWNWRERAAGYDHDLAIVEMAARRRALAQEAERWATRQAELREHEWQASMALLHKAQEMLAFPLSTVIEEDGRTVIQPARWSLRDVAAFYEMSSKLARAAAEMDQPGHQLSRAIQRELDIVLDQLERRLPPELFLQVLDIVSDESEPESELAARPGKGRGRV